jgi:hypothetical protein
MNDSATPDGTPDLRALLGRVAAARARAPAATFGMGMNLKPNRFHLDHADGDAIAALKIIGEHAADLLAALPADAPAAP